MPVFTLLGLKIIYLYILIQVDIKILSKNYKHFREAVNKNLISSYFFPQIISSSKILY